MNELVIKGWIARDENNRLYLYSNEPFKAIDMWVGNEITELDEYKFPTITFKDETPTQVELKININFPLQGNKN